MKGRRRGLDLSGEGIVALSLNNSRSRCGLLVKLRRKGRMEDALNRFRVFLLVSTITYRRIVSLQV